MSLSKERVFSIMESFLFMSPEPRPISDFSALFKGELSIKEIKDLLKEFQDSYNKTERGVLVENIAQGWQMRTKTENTAHLLKIKAPGVFRLSRPSLEVLAIVAYEQPCTKAQIDEIRGVESGHLLRSLIEKELIYLSGKSDLPGKPSLFKSSKKFLQVFGLDSLKDLPSQEEIQDLLSDTKSEESLQSISEDLISKEDTRDTLEKDEKENKRIRDVLKSLPSTVNFLEEEKESKNLAKETVETELETSDTKIEVNQGD